MAADQNRQARPGGGGRPELDRLEELGIVGAGGGGFPTAVKLRTKVPLVIVNGAECEPLLHKDKELLLHHSDAMLLGLRTAMDRVGASDGVIGIKAKYANIIHSISQQAPDGIRVLPLPDTYPAGDEFILVYEVTGRVIPPGGLPRDVGAVVLNVETLVNIGFDQPVTHKYLTVAGAVTAPVTLRVPVGMSAGEVIEVAGGASTDDFGILLGGVMMARCGELDTPVTKATGGIVVLPSSHKLIQRHQAKGWHVQRNGRSACDQCRFCTEFCPRYLLGHPIEPHRAMQALGFTGVTDAMIAGTLYCCECNLCTMYACPEDLDPKTVCARAKPMARDKGLTFRGKLEDITPHPLARSRRVPIRRLMLRLGLNQFRNVGPLDDRPLSPRRVRIPLHQHAGAPAVAIVKPGDRVVAGDLLAVPRGEELGARIHASIDGIVRSVTDAIEIEA
ncbi:MAG: 4Fe-4S dicluster domain-containing protein [Terriglobales bacterium]